MSTSAAARLRHWGVAAFQATLRPRPRTIEISALTLASALLGFLFLARESIWLDEAFSIKLAGSGWSTVWQQLSQTEANGSFYYVLLHFWLAFGKGEFAVRSFSVLAASAAIPPFYAMAARLFSLRAARIGSLLLVTNSFLVYFQQEARSYALTLLFVVLASYVWTRWLDEPSFPWAAAYVVTASLSVYAHLFSLYVIAAHAVVLLARRHELPSFRWLAAVYAAILTLLVPLILYFATGDTGKLWWVRRPSFHDLGGAFKNLSGGGGGLAGPGSILLLGYVAAGCLALLAARKELRAHRDSTWSWPYVLVLSWLFFPTLGSFFASFWKPMFIDRYLVVALPALALLAGVGLASIEARRIRIAVVGILLVLSIGELSVQYRNQTKENWRQAVAYVSAHEKAGDAIVFYAPYVRMPFEYYLNRDPGLRARVAPLYPASAWGRFDLAVDQSRPLSIAELARTQQLYDRVWLVLANNELSQTDATTTKRLSALLAPDRISSSRTFRGPISVTLYRRSPAS